MCPNEGSHASTTIEGNKGKEVEPTNKDVDPGEVGGNGIRVRTPEGCGEDERASWSGKGDTNFMARMREFLIEASPAAQKV